MVKSALLIVGAIFVVGCAKVHTPEYYASLRAQREESLKQEFRQVYGADWQQKYLEYKTDIERLRAENPPVMPDIVSVPAPTRGVGTAELYKRYRDEARQLNRENSLRSMEQSLREMSRYQRYGY